MEKTRIMFFSLPVVTIITAFLIIGCGEPELESRWRDREIEIDGKNLEWRGLESYYDEENDVRVGIINDELNLYICIYTLDRKAQAQILMQGLTIWLYSEGGKKETFGIHYPMKKMGMGMGMDMSRERSGSRRGSIGEDREDPEMIDSMLTESRGKMEIIGPEENARLSVSINGTEKLGIETAIDITNRVLVYELKVPLSHSDQSRYAVGTEPGAKIGVGFKVGKMERPQGGFPGGGMGEPPGGGMGRPPGGGMGEPPGGGMGGRRPSFESLDLWTKVKLATESSGTAEE
jgi:hypothetical protein